MHALTVRWSLADAEAGVEEKLAAYVADTSHARFTGMEGLRYFSHHEVKSAQSER